MGLFERTPRFVKRFGDLAGGDQRGRGGLCRRGEEPRLPDRGADLPRQEVSLPFRTAAWLRSGGGRARALMRCGPERYVDGRPWPVRRLPRIGDLSWRSSPNDGETFLREVDDELRREQINQTSSRATAGGSSAACADARRDRRLSLVVRSRQARGAGRGARRDPARRARTAWRPATASRRDAADRRARRERQSRAIAPPPCSPAPTRQIAERRQSRGASPRCGAIADDESLDQAYRDAALIRQTQLEFDSLQPQEVIQRLTALADRRQRLVRRGRRDGRRRPSEDEPPGSRRAALRARSRRDEKVPAIDPHSAPSRWPARSAFDCPIRRCTRVPTAPAAPGRAAPRRHRPRRTPPHPPKLPQRGKKPDEAYRRRPGLSSACLPAAASLGSGERRTAPRRPSASASRCSAPRARSRSIPLLAAIPVTDPRRRSPIPTGPQSGGNAAKSMGHVALGDAPRQAWSVSIGDGSSAAAGSSSEPVVADGRVYTIDTRAAVRAFNVAERRGDLGAPGPRREQPARDPVRRRRHLSTMAASMRPTAPATSPRSTPRPATQVWMVKPGGPLRGAPTVANDNVYVVSQDNQLYALNAAERRARAGPAPARSSWPACSAPPRPPSPSRRSSPASPRASSPPIATRTARSSGRTRSPAPASRTTVGQLSDIDADPVIDNGRVFAVGQGGRMVAVELITGQRVWEFNIAGISTPWVAGDWVFVVTDRAQLLAVSRVRPGADRAGSRSCRATATPKDNATRAPIFWRGPILAGNRLILASSRGQIVLRLADRRRASRRPGGTAHADVAAADRREQHAATSSTTSGRLTAWR